MTNLRETFLVEAPCHLTEAAVLDAYDRAHRHEARADELAEKLKADTKDRKEDIRRLRAEARQHRLMAAARIEVRDVPCYQELRGSQVVTVRIDTGAVIDQRAATAEDQQQTFPGLDQSDELPLAPDYTPSDAAPKAPTEKKARKASKPRGKKPALALVTAP